MHQDKSKLVDQGWKAMHVILDKEMPQEKKRRRGFFFLLGGLGVIGLVLSVFFYQSIHLTPSKQQVLLEKESVKEIESEKNNSPTSTVTNRNSNTEITTIEATEKHLSKTSSPTREVASGLENKSFSDVLKRANESQVGNDRISTSRKSQRPVHSTGSNLSSPKIKSEAIDKRTFTKSTGINLQTPLPSVQFKDSENPKQQLLSVQKNTTAQQIYSRDKNIAIEKRNADLDIASSNPIQERQSLFFAKIETLNSSLHLPVSRLPVMIPIKYIDKSDILLDHGMTIGFTGGYGIHTIGLSYQGFVGYERQLSKAIHLEFRLGYGRLHVASNSDSQNNFAAFNPTTIESADPTPSTDQSPEAPQGPAGPGAIPITPADPMFMLNPTELRQLSISNVSSLSALTNGLYAHWNFTRKIGLSFLAGVDYIHLPSFRPVYIVNEVELANTLDQDQFTQSQHRAVDFIFTNQWKANSGLYFNYAIGPSLTLSGGYKYYITSLGNQSDGSNDNQDSDINLDQLNLGIRYKF